MAVRRPRIQFLRAAAVVLPGGHLCHTGGLALRSASKWKPQRQQAPFEPSGYTSVLQ